MCALQAKRHRAFTSRTNIKLKYASQSCYLGCQSKEESGTEGMCMVFEILKKYKVGSKGVSNCNGTFNKWTARRGNTYDEGGMIREIINVTNACWKNGLVGKNGCEGVQVIR